jgi:hypothetical protein
MHVFHVRAVAIYFTALIIWKTSTSLAGGAAISEAVMYPVSLIPLALAAIGLLSLFGWLIARSTIYTITNERVVIRAGVALPKAVNVPFAIVGSAALRSRPTGNGDIPLQLTGPDRCAYLGLWPHVRPWRFSRAEPMLRGIPDAAHVAEILAGAMAEKAGQPSPRVAVQEAEKPRHEPMPGHAAAMNT